MIHVLAGARLGGIQVGEHSGQVTAGHQQRRERLAQVAERPVAFLDGSINVPLTRGHDTEGDVRFGERIGARSRPSKSVLAWMPSLARFSAILSSASIR